MRGLRDRVAWASRALEGLPAAGRFVRRPEIARFFGIVIRRFAEPGAPHHRPHVHASYQDEVGIFAVDGIEPIGGGLPRRQRRLVEARAEIHQHERRESWERLQAGRAPLKIEPLR